MIKLENVSKIFNGIAALSDISFQMDTGKAVALTGPSGGGKTTILRLIAGFEVPDSGQITIDNRIVSRKNYACPPHERGIGMVFQKHALWPHMTLEQNIYFGLKGMSRDSIRERLDELFLLTHLKGLEGRYPHQVSGGEAQRASLARAIAPEPAILFLDEPMMGLDYNLVLEMNEILREIHDKSATTIIYVSHDFQELKTLTDSVILLSGGEILYYGSWKDLPDERIY